ncbi:MAG: DUF1579 domain-containing protein [Planctomycetes bacterium]|nr:DUF1579 domain-containing protein [Planctomycetota bacterium]
MGCGCKCSSPGMMIGVMVAAGAVIATAVSVGGWGEKPEPANVGVTGLVQPEGFEMDPVMAAWIEAGTPDEHHALLEAFVGEWTTHAVFQMTPEAPPMESTGSDVSEMIFDGRYLVSHVRGDMMGMPFQGRSVMGYDKVQKKFVGMWIDSMSTMIFTNSGQYDPASRTFTMTSTYTDPMGDKKRSKHVTTILSSSERTLEFYEADAESNEWHKTGTITYTRK